MMSFLVIVFNADSILIFFFYLFSICTIILFLVCVTLNLKASSAAAGLIELFFSSSG